MCRGRLHVKDNVCTSFAASLLHKNGALWGAVFSAITRTLVIKALED